MNVGDTNTQAMYRVVAVGGDLTDDARAALTAAGASWEGSGSAPGEPLRHRVLIRANTERDAVAAVHGELARYGSYDDFAASAIRDSRGDPWRGPFYRSWHEIDWEAVLERASLTDFQRAVLRCLLNDAEPTWIIVADPDVSVDREVVEATLEDLQERKLVQSALDEGGEPNRESELDRWWAVTPEGWDLLGLIKI